MATAVAQYGVTNWLGQAWVSDDELSKRILEGEIGWQKRQIRKGRRDYMAKDVKTTMRDQMTGERIGYYHVIFPCHQHPNGVVNPIHTEK